MALTTSMSETPEYIRFRCTRCTHALKVKARFSGRKVYCPACYQELTVPNESDPDRRTASPGQLYGVDALPRDTRQMADRFAFAEVDCPLCGTKIAVRESDVGTTVECPDCGTMVAVTREKLSAKNDYFARLHAQSAPVDPAAKTQIDPNGVYGVDANYQPPERQAAENVPPEKKKFPVHCPLCDTLQYADKSQIGTKFRCPDCETEFTVRAPLEPKSPKPATGTLNFEGGTVYGIAPQSRTLLSDADRRALESDPAENPNLLAVVCRLCGTLMYAPKEEVGQRKKCPDCGTETLIEEPNAEKKVADEVIEPTFSGGYAVEQTPSAEERFYHEPDFLLGKVKTPIEKKLEEERLRQRGEMPVSTPKSKDKSPRPAPANTPQVPSNAPPVPSNAPQVPFSNTPPAAIPPAPVSAPPRQPLVRSSFERRDDPEPLAGTKKAPPERFVPKPSPATPVADAVNRKNQAPRTTPNHQTPRPAPTRPSAPPPRISPEDRTLAGLAALEQNIDSFDGSGLDGFTPTELPQIDPHRTFRRKSRKSGKNKGKKSSPKNGANDFNGLVAKINDRGDVVLSVPPPPTATMGPNVFAPLAASLFWSRWATPLSFGVIAAAILYFIVYPCVQSIASSGLLASRGFAMIIVSASVFAAIFTALALSSAVLNFFSTFFALCCGHTRVEDWMDQDLIEGITSALRLLAMETVALIPAILTQVFGENLSVTLAVALGSSLAFFPLIFLSSMQTDFPVMPITGTVFASLFRRFGTWFFFYLWSALLIGLPLWGLSLLSFGAVQAALLFTALIFMPPIYSVLLGRLGWVIEEMARD